MVRLLIGATLGFDLRSQVPASFILQTILRAQPTPSTPIARAISFSGPELPIQDVRSIVAIGGKADVLVTIAKRRS